jgi:hypothetical protein
MPGIFWGATGDLPGFTGFFSFPGLIFATTSVPVW